MARTAVNKGMERVRLRVKVLLTLNRVVWISLLEKVTFKGNARTNQGALWRKTVLGRGRSRAKALRWEYAQGVGGTARRPVWLSEGRRGDMRSG